MEDTYSCWYFASSADVSRCICAICLDISPRIGSISATASWRAMRFLALNRLTYSSSWSSLISVISWISAAAFGPSSCNSSRRSSPIPRRSRSLRFLRHCFNPSTCDCKLLSRSSAVRSVLESNASNNPYADLIWSARWLTASLYWLLRSLILSFRSLYAFATLSV